MNYKEWDDNLGRLDSLSLCSISHLPALQGRPLLWDTVSLASWDILFFPPKKHIRYSLACEEYTDPQSNGRQFQRVPPYLT